MKAIHSPGSGGLQRGIVLQLMLPEILQGGGHLFEVIDLGPAFISGAFARAQTLLYINNEVDALGRQSLLPERRDGAFPGNHGPDVGGIVAFPPAWMPGAGWACPAPEQGTRSRRPARTSPHTRPRPSGAGTPRSRRAFSPAPPRLPHGAAAGRTGDAPRSIDRNGESGPCCGAWD